MGSGIREVNLLVRGVQIIQVRIGNVRKRLLIKHNLKTKSANCSTRFHDLKVLF
jgi:hypothetical protein